MTWYQLKIYTAREEELGGTKKMSQKEYSDWAGRNAGRVMKRAMG
jgi:hypothetical protein